MKSIRDLVVLWNLRDDAPDGHDAGVKVADHPPSHDSEFDCTWGGCNRYVHTLGWEDRKKMAFIEAVHIHGVDGLGPSMVDINREFMKIAEYVDGCSDEFLQSVLGSSSKMQHARNEADRIKKIDRKRRLI